MDQMSQQPSCCPAQGDHVDVTSLLSCTAYMYLNCTGQVEMYPEVLVSTRLVLEADHNNVKALYRSGKVSVVVAVVVGIVCVYLISLYLCNLC